MRVILMFLLLWVVGYAESTAWWLGKLAGVAATGFKVGMGQ
jgi:hypothetical protein